MFFNRVSLNFFYKVRGASSDPCSEAFHGEEPLSEKEVQSVARFLESQKKRLVGYLDIHSYGQMLLFPWGYTKEQTKDHIEMVGVRGDRLLLIFRLNKKVFEIAPPFS